MISKNDCLSLLVKLEDNGVQDINRYIRTLMASKDIPFEVIKFISEHQGIEATTFYEILRKNYNLKKTPLYYNIVSEKSDISEVLVTLSSFLTQIFLHCRHMEEEGKKSEVDLFLKEVRAEEVSKVLHQYCIDGLAENCIKLLKIIRADVVVFEYIADRREIIS